MRKIGEYVCLLLAAYMVVGIFVVWYVLPSDAYDPIFGSPKERADFLQPLFSPLERFWALTGFQGLLVVASVLMFCAACLYYSAIKRRRVKKETPIESGPQYF